MPSATAVNVTAIQAAAVATGVANQEGANVTLTVPGGSSITNGTYVVYGITTNNIISAAVPVFTASLTAPTGTVATQTVSGGTSVTVQSNSTGSAYLVPSSLSTTAVDSVSELDALVNGTTCTKVAIATANTNTAITAPTTGGAYKLVVADAAGNVSAMSANTVTVNFAAPTLTADSTSNNVDNALDLTFAEDATWRTSITDVKVDGASIAGQYSTATPGVLHINQGAITGAGNHTITVIATGYSNATVTQAVTAGALSLTNSSWSDDVDSNINSTSVYTLYARDQYGNPIQGYQFALNLNVLNANGTNMEQYIVNGHTYVPPVNASGQALAILPSDVGVTDSNGMVQVSIDYIPGGAYDVGDGGVCAWYDASGNNPITENPAD